LQPSDGLHDRESLSEISEDVVDVLADRQPHIAVG
jgi:hypothetical protein